LPGSLIQLAEIPRLLLMIEDDLLVEFAKVNLSIRNEKLARQQFVAGIA
jgi:hypothetical protein